MPNNMASPRRIIALLMALLLVVLATEAAEEQPGTPSCVTDLSPCADYLNSTKPPDSCCTPLKHAVLHHMDCLCNFYANSDLLKAFNVNMTQALLLPLHCGISIDANPCKAKAPGSSPTPAVPGGNHENHGNGVSRIASTVGLSSFLLLGASLMLW